jgi:hypothetical protein
VSCHILRCCQLFTWRREPMMLLNHVLSVQLVLECSLQYWLGVKRFPPTRPKLEVMGSYPEIWFFSFAYFLSHIRIPPSSSQHASTGCSEQKKLSIYGLFNYVSIISKHVPIYIEVAKYTQNDEISYVSGKENDFLVIRRVLMNEE